MITILEAVVDVLVKAGIAQGVLYLLLYKRSGHLSQWWFFSVLVVLSLIILRINYLYFYLWEHLGSTFFGSGPFLFLLAPVLYLYLRSIVIPEQRIKPGDLIHFIPFVAISLFTVLLLLIAKGHYVFLREVIGSPWLFMIIQFGFYLFQSHRLIKLHSQKITQGLSNIEGFDVSWIRTVLWLFGLLLFFFIVITPLLIHGISLTAYQKSSAVFFSLLSFFISYKGIRQKVPNEAYNVPQDQIENPDQPMLQSQKEKLLDYMDSQKPYLDPELTLSDLAGQLSMGRNQLSLLINSGIGDNFYNFVNTYRVNEVKRLINEDKSKRYTIMALAHDAGFNSKSSFNHIFKKVTGLTPSEYRNGLS